MPYDVLRRLRQPIFQGIILSFAVLVILLLTGCNETEYVTPDKIQSLRKGVRHGALGSRHVIRVSVLGMEVKTFLGGKTQPQAGGVRTRFEIVSDPSPSESRLFSDIGDPIDGDFFEIKTTPGGEAAAVIVLSNYPGVVRVRASLPDYPDVKATTIVFLNGLVIRGNRQDGWVNGALDEPITVSIQQALNQPAENASLMFEVMQAPPKTRIEPGETRTDAEGEARVAVKLGSEQGPGQIAIRLINTPLGEEASRYTVTANFFIIDRVGLLINIVGGLAVFIFGMRLMSEGLSLTAGDRLRALLNALTKNRFAAAGAGLLVTGLIQSSSACTVIVIGFVNAGLIQLEQAIGVIMGSNIGTTITAQMISFKLDSLALPAISIGVVILLLAKENKTKFMAQVLIGFGILFLGMTMLSSPLKELRSSEMVSSMFHNISCAPKPGGMIPVVPAIIAVGIGTLVTVTVQSSSASIGLLIALAAARLIDPYTAFVILLGDNIGTTITAILASIGANRSAKRAACAHCLFNIAGTIIMLILLFVPWPGTGGRPVFMELVSRITPGDNFSGDNLPRFLANAHTMFNVSCTLLFIGFVPLFARACRFIIRGEDEVAANEHISKLEPHLLATPAIALQQAWAEMGFMLETARMAHGQSAECIPIESGKDADAIWQTVKAQENLLDELQNAITDYLSGLSMKQLNKAQSTLVPKLLHSVNDVERIGDHSVHLLRLGKRTRKRSLPMTQEARDELMQMNKTIDQLFRVCQTTVGCVASDRPENCAEDIAAKFSEARSLAKELRKQEKNARRSHVSRHEAGACDVQTAVVFLDALRILNRTGGHLMNVMEALAAVKAADKS